MAIDVPVLLLVFNRPNPTRKVFEQVRKAKPQRLYVAGDGPRADHPDDSVRVNETRAVLEAIDWDCDVKTRFSDSNKGCKRGPQTGIDWFFENERLGIILEDDCVPHADFFRFCSWALKTYQADSRIWHINGNNFGAAKSLYSGQSHSFTRWAQVWGWASWADRWQMCEQNPFYLEEQVAELASQWPVRHRARSIKRHHLENLKKGLETWDYQWQMTILNNRGLCVSPSSNLVSNIGDGDDATHTGRDRRAHLPTKQIDESLRPLKAASNVRLDRCYEKHMGLAGVKSYIRVISQRSRARLRKTVGKAARNAVRAGRKPIVVASTGRSGSTMLTGAISESYIDHRFSWAKTEWLFKLLRRLVSDFKPRLAALRSGAASVVKTHDLFDPSLCSDARYIFVFGDPLESAMSVEAVAARLGYAWFEQHLYHLRSRGKLEDLYTKDVLNYRKQIESWVFSGCPNVLCIPYERIWELREEISLFVGFDVQLPPRRERPSKHAPASVDHDLFSKLREIYEKAVALAAHG